MIDVTPTCKCRTMIEVGQAYANLFACRVFYEAARCSAARRVSVGYPILEG